MNINDPLLEAIVEGQRKLTELRVEHWINQEVFTWQWWVLVLLLIVPWVIWWKIVDRRRIFEIFSYGMLVVVISTVLDGIGLEAIKWTYPYKIFPILPRLLPVDFSVLPFLYMVIYQYFPRWKPFIIASVVGSAFYSFAAEPVFVHFGFYKLLRWEHYYSFPIYIMISVGLKLMIETFRKNKSRNGRGRK